MAELIIAWGSNLGDRAAYAAAAQAQVNRRVGECLAASPTFVTAPLGPADRPFLNGAWRVRTHLSPHASLTTLLAIEASLGRERRERWGNRTMDLDILMWRADDGSFPVIDDEALTIPHPELLQRDFALVPAAAVAPDWRHPLSGRCLADEVARRAYALQSLPEP